MKNGLDFADSDDSFDLGPNPNSNRYDQQPTNSKGNFNNFKKGGIMNGSGCPEYD
jgi:hypothetical protein